MDGGACLKLAMKGGGTCLKVAMEGGGDCLRVAFFFRQVQQRRLGL